MRPAYAVSGGVSKFAKARLERTFQAVIKEAYDYAIANIGLDFPSFTNAPAQVHTFTVCCFGSNEFLAECPFVLSRIEFEGEITFLLTRLMGIDPNVPSLDWIGMLVKPHLLRNFKLKPIVVFFRPHET